MKWDYVLVNLVRSYGMNYRRNGIKMAEWKDKPVFEVMQILGDEGYEFAAYDGQNYIFKKPIGAPQQAQPVQRPAQPGQPTPGQPMQRPQQPGQPQPGQPMQRPAQPGPQPGQPMQRPQQPGAGSQSGVRALPQRPPAQTEDES